MTKQHTLAYLEALFAVTVWGANFVFTKVALREASPATIVWLRFGMGVIVLGIAVAIRKQFQLPRASELGYFIFLGFMGVTFHQWLQATGLLTAGATTTAWIVATIPIFTAILGWLVLKERLNRIRILGIALAGAGVLLIVSHGDISALFSGKFGTIGDMLVLISAPNWAIFSVLSRRGLREHPATQMMLYVMTFGFIFCTGWLFGLGPGLSEIPHITMNGWINVFVLGILGSGLAYIAWYDALQSLPAAQAGAFINIEPLVTMVVAAIVLGEAITIGAVLGGAVVLLGVYLVNRRAN